jgi:hypothetical protein
MGHSVPFSKVLDQFQTICFRVYILFHLLKSGTGELLSDLSDNPALILEYSIPLGLFENC